MIHKRLKGFIGKRSIEDLAEKTGVSESTLKRIIYSSDSNPSIYVLKAICDELNIGIDDLFINPKTTEETALLTEFNKLSKQDKHSVMMLAKAKACKMANSEKEKHTISILVSTNNVVDGIQLDTCLVEKLETHIDNAYMGFKIPNMFFSDYNFFLDDIVLLEYRDSNVGELGVFTDGTKAYFRKLDRENGKFVLRSLKKNATDIVIEDYRQWRCLGTVIGKP